ncbi:MAG: hypothetical protein M3O93_06670 [Chloroflexota bacterium]|nr:hypothetical protein [Chloroflexota bacterium]
MDIGKVVTVEAPIASVNAVSVRNATGDTLSVATAIIEGTRRRTDRPNTPRTVPALSIS